LRKEATGTQINAFTGEKTISIENQGNLLNQGFDK